jgi:hypothetical protein
VAQVVELLLCKPEALSSNPTPTKKKKKKTLFVIVKHPTTGVLFTTENELRHQRTQTTSPCIGSPLRSFLEILPFKKEGVLELFYI